jgi:hypothetical protein
LARINELKTSISQGVVEFEIRSRSGRIQVLQNQLDDMLDLQRARALLYADHPEGSTGLVVKGYRGQKAKKAIWKFDAALVTQILNTLKQAAIEVGEWNQKRVPQESPRVDSLSDRIMPVLHNAKHERFAQFVAKGLSPREAYSSAGYSKAGARSNAARMIANEGVLARINELKTSISQGVIEREIRGRWARIRILQNLLDHMLDLERARALLYAYHPEGSTGLVMKDYRGQKAQKEIWKFDAALSTKVLHTLKQAAIEAGQWMEKRAPNGWDEVPVDVVFVKPPPRDETGAIIDVQKS